MYYSRPGPTLRQSLLSGPWGNWLHRNLHVQNLHISINKIHKMELHLHVDAKGKSITEKTVSNK